jgi:hypothetical protein
MLVVEGTSTLNAGITSNDGEVHLIGPAATIMTSGFTNNNGGVVRGDGRIVGNLTNAVGGELRADVGKNIRVLNLATVANNGRINLQGGTVEFTGSVTNGSSGDITGRGSLSTTQLNNQGDVAFSSGITDVFGDVLNQSGGRITVSGNADVTFWDDVSQAGSLLRDSAGSSATFFGTYSGGSITGGGDTYFEADVSPGFSPAAITIGGDVTFGSDAKLKIEIGGTMRGTEYDALTISGDAVLDGALEITFLNGFTPSLGDSFNFIEAASVSGAFDSVILPELDGFLGWDVTQLASGVFSIVSELPGDANRDGADDAADYVMLRKLGGAGFPTAYEDWRARFNETVGGNAAGGSVEQVSALIPEPSSVAMLILATAVGLGFRRDQAVERSVKPLN